ncbi:hypothetical protein FTW19_03135 [Terriglobus albidus]|uniref:Uncharacterized protein n=2 Tax=Terriglobus albidus TaxID=1592106 RepID=A0A5B9E4C2_9BACT|nr:hypothetical protein FTW19_03135 [Terriglobus albidus]
MSPLLPAQVQKAATLGEILQRLEANLNRYDTRLPSLFCDEEVISKVEPGLPDQNTVTEAIFRLKRTPNPDGTTSLIESREIKSANGKAARKQNTESPTLLDGAFEGGLAVVSVNQAACINYTLQRAKKNRPMDPYTARFATVLTSQDSAKCLLSEKSTGVAIIDPTSMEITHLEIRTPRHVIQPGYFYQSAVVGQRVITVDYAPVALNGETFWLPSTINLQVTQGAGTFHKTVWSFLATYRNYHQLQVTSRIVHENDRHVP